jgi:hypothetical protein
MNALVVWYRGQRSKMTQKNATLHIWEISKHLEPSGTFVGNGQAVAHA